MNEKTALSKGYALEETLRAYFLRAGFLVYRGVPVSFSENELTDVDLWMYERPTGTSRRVQFLDAKHKQRPKAVERLFWTKGLVCALDADGAYVATTDSRPFLRKLAATLGLSIIDGADIKRIQASASVMIGGRLTDEQFLALIHEVDKGRRNKALQDERIEVLASLSDGFGVASLVRALECFSRLAQMSGAVHPGSAGAEVAVRLAYLAASIAVASLDFLSVTAPFRSVEERREILLTSVRYGVMGQDDSASALETALRLVRRYAKNGPGIATAIEAAVRADFDAIPAEIVADQAARFMKDGQLFSIARELEAASYSTRLPTFDELSTSEKSMLGALLDYSGVSRVSFASCMPATSKHVAEPIAEKSPSDEPEESTQPMLFSGDAVDQNPRE